MTLNLDAVREADVLGTPPPKVKLTATKTDPAPPANKGGRPKGSTTDPQKREESALRSKLDTVLDRLADTLEGRDDLELSTAIREDSKAIANGLIGLTRQIAPLRGVLVLVVALAEPLLAFGRIGRILLGRAQRRRLERLQAMEDAAAAPAPDVFSSR